MTASAVLSQHRPEGDPRKTYTVDWDRVKIAPAPKASDTYCAVAHTALVAMVEEACTHRGLLIDTRQYAMNRAGSQFLGVFTLRGDVAGARDYQLAMGLRNSTDKTLSAGLVTGAHVFVCDNSCFSGEVHLSRRHTRFILRDLPGLVSHCVDHFLSAAVNQAHTFEHWKTVRLNLDQATLLAVRMAEFGAIPSNGIMAIRKEFQTPRHREFLANGHTAWTFYNAATQYLTHDRGQVAPAKAQRDFLDVHSTLARAYPLPAAAVN